MTKAAFIIDRMGVIETYSIPLLSAVAKQHGHPVTLVEYDQDPAKAIAALKAFDPDVLCYSVMSPDANRYLGINREIREHIDAYSLFGGVHPTFFQDYLMEDGVDAICVGEGDLSFRQFLDDFGKSAMYDVPNFHFRQGDTVRKNCISNLVDDLDSLPFPDKELIYQNSYFVRNLPIRGFFTTRGCPYKCTYCFNHSFNDMYRGKGKVVRMKSVDYALQELKGTVDRYPTQFLKFHDDVFGVRKDWLAEFADRYPKDVGLPFLILARPNMVTDEYCKQLKKAGCHSVTIAIESGNEFIRNKVMLRAMSEELMATAFENLNRYGFKINALNMIGLPHETEDTVKETVALNRKYGVHYADASIFQPYPGVSITKYAMDNGYLEGEQQSWGGQYSKSVLNFPEEQKDQMHTYQALFPLMVEYPWLDKFIKALIKFNKTGIGDWTLQKIYRFTYGYMMHKRIYPVKVPLKLKAWAATQLLLSANRN